jgi:hypothetical protein
LGKRGCISARPAVVQSDFFAPGHELNCSRLGAVFFSLNSRITIAWTGLNLSLR